MANAKRETELVRVNFNLPLKFQEQVKDYSNELGISIAATYTLLIQKGLEQKETIEQLPKLVDAFKQAIELQEKELLKEEKKKEIE